MAQNVFDAEVINPRERPLCDDVNAGVSQLHASLRFVDMLRYMKRGAASVLTPDVVLSGFLGSSFKVRASASPDMNVHVDFGMGYQDLNAGTVVNGDAALLAAIGGVVGVDDLMRYKPLPLATVQNFTVPPAPSAGNSRIDIIEVKCDRRLQDSTTRDILNSMTGIFAPGTVDKILAYLLDGRGGTVVDPANSTTGIGYKTGTVYSGTSYNGANVPATTSGYIKLAEIYVGPSVTTIAQSKIGDFRTLLFAGDEAYAEGTVHIYQDDDGMFDFSQIAAHNILSCPPGVEVGARAGVLGDDLGWLLYVSAGAGYSRPGSLQLSCSRISGTASVFYVPYIETDPAITAAAGSGDITTWGGSTNIARGQMFQSAQIGAAQFKFANGDQPWIPVSAGGVPSAGDHVMYHYRIGLPRP